MGHEAIASNLRRLRLQKGLSQEELAQLAELSTPAYRNIESKKSVPRVDTLESLADALKVNVQDLISPSRNLHHVRFRSLKRLNTRGQILTEVADRLAQFNELEDLLDKHKEYKLGSLRIRRTKDAHGFVEKAAAEVRGRVGLNDAGPVRDICGLLEANGIKILPVEVASDAFFGLSIAADDGGPAIVVNTWERISVERWIFTAAHEFAHLLLHLGSFDVDQTQEEKQEELEANLFGSYFLMPEQTFQKEWEETYGLSFVDRVLKVKRMFRVSYKTVLYRIAQMYGSVVWGYFQTEYRQRSGRTLLKQDEPDALKSDAWHSTYPEESRAGEPENLSPHDFKEDRLSRLVRMAFENQKITKDRAAEILGLEVNEMRARIASWRKVK
jgi:Zn-dependent peptidase ImmA (M78 family)/transcriptional regulator with XRE-family HTH domain